MKYGLFIIGVVLVAQPVFASDFSSDTSSDSRISKSKDINLKSSKDKRDTAGKRNSKDKSTGNDSTASETIRSMGQAQQNASLDVSLPLANVFSSAIIDEESRPVPASPFNAKILTAPKLPADFGITYMVRQGLSDSVKQGYLQKAAASNDSVQSFADEASLLSYRDALAKYGAIIGQAYLYLANDIDEVQGSVKKDDSGNIHVKGIGYDDFVILAKGAFRKAVASGVKNKALLDNMRVALAPAECRFAGAVESFQCGATAMQLGASPQLQVAGIKWYGPEGVGGFSGAYRVSSSWSYTSSLEKLQSEAKYEKFAKSWQVYSEDQETNGRSLETILARKKALDLAKQNKTSLSPNKFLPGIH